MHERIDIKMTRHVKWEGTIWEPERVLGVWDIFLHCPSCKREKEKKRHPTPSRLGVVNVLLICKSGHVVQLLKVVVLNNHSKDLLSSSFVIKSGV